MIKTQIKAGQITNLTDARYFAARGVKWLGFNLYPGTEGYLAPAQTYAIRDWVEGPLFLGEFGLQPAEEIAETATIMSLDTLQIGMFGPVEAVYKLCKIPIISERIPEGEESPENFLRKCHELSPFTDIYFFNFEKAGLQWRDFTTGDIWSVDWLKNCCKTYKIILSFDQLTPADLLDILEKVQPEGLNVMGGAEEKTGFKSFDELDELFDVLEED